MIWLSRFDLKLHSSKINRWRTKIRKNVLQYKKNEVLIFVAYVILYFAIGSANKQQMIRQGLWETFVIFILFTWKSFLLSRGYMFFSEWDRPANISRANMDGTDVKVIKDKVRPFGLLYFHYWTLIYLYIIYSTLYHMLYLHEH